VGAVDAHDAIASFSPATMDSVGAIDLCAPGQGVFSASALDQQGAYWSSASGTSAAAPIVSGVAALHLELTPTLTVDELVGRLKGDARTTPDHNARDFGSGIVRVPS
jgi:subtilisin